MIPPFSTQYPPTTATQLNLDLKTIERWANQWLVNFNSDKTETMVFSSKNTKPLHPNLFFNNQTLKQVPSHTHLGLVLSTNLSWSEHINKMVLKANKAATVLKRLKYKLSQHSLHIIYKTCARQILEYADVVWCICTEYESELIGQVQDKSAITISGATISGTTTSIYLFSRWSVGDRRLYNVT